MGKNKNNISPVKKGMNRNTAPYLLQGMEYLFALNTNIQDDDTSVINVTNEESNILAAKFKDGFKVIGKKNDIISKGTYFFLVNPETKESEFGIIRNNQIEQTDILDELETPLEEVEQTPYLQYETLIDKGLSLHINYPVHKIVIKNEQGSKVIAFTDDYNPPRLIRLDKLGEYMVQDKEVDPEKITIFKNSLLPKINVKPIVTGGRLKRGTYQPVLAYCNKLGEEISEYTAITNPIPIFDSNNRIQDSLEERTNFAIKLKIDKLDQSKDYYKVIIIQNTGSDGGVEYFEEGIHPVSDDSVIYATEENKIRSSFDIISKTFPTVKKWKGLTEVDGHLVGYGITKEKEINLQPVVNLMGAFLKWQTSVARESLYESGDDVSTSKGYMRDETYPFGIRVFFKSGYKTANFPFVNRPADTIEYRDGNSYYELENAPNSKDIQSIKEHNPAYSSGDRKEFWKYYNTATLEGQRDVKVDYNLIQEPITKTSLIKNVGDIPAPSGKIRMKLGYEPFTTLEDFIEDNHNKWQGTNHPLNFLFEELNEDNYTNIHDVPDFDNCDTPIHIEERDEIVIQDILNEQVDFIKREIGEYRKVALDTNANIFDVNKDGGGLRRDEKRETETSAALHRATGEYFFVKIQPPTNTSKEYAIPLNEVRLDMSATNNTTNIGYYNDGTATHKYSDILTDYKSVSKQLDHKLVGKEGEVLYVNYDSKVSVNALWFRDEFGEDEDFRVLEIPKYVPQTRFGEIWANAKMLRVSIFNDCQDEYDPTCQQIEKEPVLVFFVDPTKGDLRELIKSELQDSTVNRTSKNNEITYSHLLTNKFLIAVDTPIGKKGNAGVAPTFNGKYSIHKRPLEYGAVDVIWDKIILDKREAYRATCDFKIPKVEEYETLPYQYGKFGYTESTETYPNNDELYNSKNLNIDLRKIPSTIKKEFKKYYIKDNPDGSFELNDNADFRNKPIRHFKFPDNDVAPFISNTRQAAFSDSIMFPLGVHIEDEVVSAFLDVAVDNGLMSQEQRDDVLGYEILRGDRTLEKSIEAKGLLYDNYQVKEENEDVYFSNFPFNTLGENHLLYKDKDNKTFIPHPYDSEENNSFSFISPDNQFRKLSTPSEMKVEGFQFGNSKSYITDVEDHPKWTILGKKAYKLANTLAIAETTAEIVINIAEATIETSKNFWFVGGVGSTGGNPVGSIVGGVATGVIAGFQILANSIFKVARYRHQWLTTFRDLGQPENFAAYSTGVGHYNSLVSYPYIGNSLRGINTIKEVGSGRYSFRHNDTGNRIVLNNKDREHSTYLYLGEKYALKYPYDYYAYDNADINENYASRTYSSNENACSVGQSREILSNVASPYVSLKNFIPSQYGSVDAIKWLPTSYVSYFDGNQDTIFGGDIFISRMTMKRKMPMFLRDAMGIASLTPFNYNFYSNVGSNRYYCNYEVSEEVNLESSFFPDFNSEYEFDCLTGKSDFYVKPPSKFYLYHYGIVDFMVESEINHNFRYGKKDYKDNFYPNVSDIVDWTQEKNVSIKEKNTFYYDFNYSLPAMSAGDMRTLPFTYSKEEFDERYDSPNGAMWSNPDNSEKDLSEPWLIYKPINSHNFPSSFGDLIDLKGIEHNRVLGRFTNQSAIFGAVDMKVDGITSEMGDGALFRGGARTFAETDLGYLGSQNVEMISNEAGHFSVDAQRGQVFRINPMGEGVEEISKYSGGKPNGMDKWFKKHLPFKVLNPLINNYEDIDVNNPFNGVGISMGWDAKNKRVFITKKDYIPLQEMNYEDKNFFGVKDEHELITDYESEGYTYLGKEDFYYKFSKRPVNIPNGTDIFIVININSYTVAEAQEIKGEVKDWASQLDDFDGEVITVVTDSDRWLDTTTQLIEDRFNAVYQMGDWAKVHDYTGQVIDNQAVILTFTSNSAYASDEPNSQFITDYKNYTSSFSEIDYLRHILISKENTTFDSHISKILNNEGEYKDYPIRGTSPQQFVEPLNRYGVTHYQNFDMNTEKALYEVLGDKFDDGVILVKGDIIDVSNTDYFKDVSWTIAYQVETGSWISYYSFTPNYYVGHNTYFQTGINNLLGKEGLWSHNMSNKSYGVFYGEKHPWTIEYPIKNEYRAKRLQNVSFWTEAKKFHNSYDFAYDRHITFNKATIYNTYGNSGNLNLIPQKTLSQITKYPITRGNSQDILITNQDFNWTFNNIHDRTLNQDGVLSAWISDENEIEKSINNDLVRFGGKKILSYLRGDYFIVRLTFDKSTEHNVLLKWSTNQEEIY